MADAARVLLFHEDGATAESLRSRLANAGFEVTGARTFLEAAPFLVTGRLDLFLIYLPETEWVRNAILTEVRRGNPALPIVALTPTMSDDLCQVLARLDIATVLPTGSSWQGLVVAIHNALGSRESASGGEQ
jgi:DNA-binding NtrC family response regulator